MATSAEAAPLRISSSPAASKQLGGAGRGRGRGRDALVFAAGVAAAVLAILGSASVLAPGSSSLLVAFPVPGPEDGPRTFYDDPELSYDAVDGRRLTGWDAKRAEWLRSRGIGRRSVW